MAKPITEKRLSHMALFYLSKYEASTEKLRQMFHRRIMKAAQQGETVPQNVSEMIEKVIRHMKSLGYVDDSRYAQMQVRILSRQGKSASFIRQKLKKDGIDLETIQACLESLTVSDFEQALCWLKKHKKGGYRLKTSDQDYKKDLAALARQGFSFPVAAQALKKSYAENEKPDLDLADFEAF